MADAAYPTDNDLAAWLLGQHVDATWTADIDLADAASDGVATFESAAGRRMLATTQTRVFDPPKPGRTILDLRYDLASFTSLTASGSAMVRNTDFWLLPENADLDGRPWSRIEFASGYSPQLGARRCISVTGKWGFGVTIPGDAWHGMLAAGALHVLSAIRLAVTGGATKWQEADVQEWFGDDPLGFLEKHWQGIFDDAVRRYRRVALA
jgi:hypothetical protein